MTPVVFIHGLMGGSAQWAEQVQALAEFDVITLDLPGFGKNAQMTAVESIADFATWVLEELSARGIQRFNLVGHSMGGMIALEMIAIAPERIDRLALYGTGATGVLPGRFETIETSKDRTREEGSKATARRIAATWFLERDQADAYEQCASIAELCSVDAIVAGLDAMSGWNGAGHLSKIANKTLVIWGDHDRTFPWHQTQQLWQSIKGAGLAVIPGCAHAPHLEKPDQFNVVLKDFVKD